MDRGKLLQSDNYESDNPTAARHSPFKPRTLPGASFDDSPFSVQLESGIFDRGGSAGIYKGVATGPSIGSLVVAVKVFGGMLSPAHQELLVRELGTAAHASLRGHRLILPFLGTVYLRDSDQKALVSLYMGNGNLLAYVRKYKECEKKKLLVQVAEAVNYLHSDVGLVHGDLKCANVLISDSGDALLADFGLSTFVEKSEFDATTMTSIRGMHTARFAAPELLLGTDDSNVRPRSKTRESDVYAFGMLILEAITTLPPWSNLNSFSFTSQVCQGARPPQPKSNGFVTISHFWWDMCQRAWNHVPEDRPPMSAVLNALTDSDPEPHRQLNGHRRTIYSVAYLPGGRRVVSGSRDGSICVWDTLTGDMVMGPLLGHQRAVWCLAISPDGSEICSGGVDNTIRRWEVHSGAVINKPMYGHAGGVTDVAFSPDGELIVSCAGDMTVRMWDASTGNAVGDILAGHTDGVFSVAVSPDGGCIASGSQDGTIRLWDSASGAMIGILNDQHAVLSLCFSPNHYCTVPGSADDHRLVSGSSDGAVRVWNVSTRLLEGEIVGHSDWVTSVALSPSGAHIASGSKDHTIRVWNAKTGDAVGAPLTKHTNEVNSVAFSPDGRSLVSGSDDDTIRVWDIFE